MSITIRPEWLALTREEILDPKRSIVDPHHHLWQRRPSYPAYLLDDLWADTGDGHRVERTIFIECDSEYTETGPESMQPIGETRFVARAARACRENAKEVARIAAIVSHADLTLGPDVRDVLLAHVEAGEGLFRGIRHRGARNDDPALSRSDAPPRGLYGMRSFRAGFKELERLELSFEAWNYHPQILELVDLAQAFSQTTIILDHLGGPIGVGRYEGKREETFAEWRSGMEELSRCNNTVVKIGGLGMPFTGQQWHDRDHPPSSEAVAEGYRPFFDHVIDHFGVDRCMFESNFPVDKVSVSYRVLWNAFKRLSAPLSETEKETLFRGTAERISPLSLTFVTQPNIHYPLTAPAAIPSINER